MEFLIKNRIGNFIFISLVHIFAFIIAYSFNSESFVKKVISFLGSNPSAIIDLHSFITLPWYKTLGGVTYLFAFLHVFIYFIYFFIGLSFFTSLGFVLIHSFRKSGQDFRPAWTATFITMLILVFLIAYLFSPRIYDALGTFIWTFSTYFAYSLIPFYISTFALCDSTAAFSYKIKTFFNS